MMSEKIHKSFTQIVIEGKGTDHIVETLYGILNRNVAFMDLVFNRNYIRSNSSKFKEDIEDLGLNVYYINTIITPFKLVVLFMVI